MAWPNGQIPGSALVLTDSGTNSDGYWEHLWAPGTLTRWRALVADVYENERDAFGRRITLVVTPGWNAYRPLQAQKDAKKKYGRNAAAPGFSSHGGLFNGRDSMAVDVFNWSLLGREKFYAYARKHGFTPNVFDWEPWHLIDYDPWVAPAGAGSTPFIPPEEDTLSAEDVQQIKAHVTHEANRVIEAMRQIPSYMLLAEVPSGLAGEVQSTLGKQIRAFWQQAFSQAERAALATGFEPGMRLVRYAKSAQTGSVFALYTDGKTKWRCQVTDAEDLRALGDVFVVDQQTLWAYDVVISTDFVAAHPGALVGHARSAATGNVFAVYRNDRGNLARRLLTPEQAASLTDVEIVEQAELWGFAPINQGA